MSKTSIFFLSLFLIGYYSYSQDHPAVKMLDPDTDQPGDQWCYLAKSTTVIGVPFQPDVTQVTYDGALFTREAELCFFYGAGDKPLLARGKTFTDGWIPIVHYTWKDGNIIYDIEYLASALQGEGTENTVNFVRLNMRNAGNEQSNGKFTVALRYNSGDYRFGHAATDTFSAAWQYEMTRSDVIRDGKLVYDFSPGGAREAMPGKIYQKAFSGEGYITPRAACCLVQYMRTLKPGAQFTAIFKMPRVPVALSDTGFIGKLKSADYQTYRKSTMDYWNTTMSKGTVFNLPEKRFQDAYRAGVVHALLATREQNGKRYQTDGLPYPDFFLTSVPEMSMLYLSSGLSQYPQNMLIPGAIAQQQRDGLFFDISVAHGKIIPATQGHILYSIAMTAIFTQDKAFAEKVYPSIEKGIGYIERSINTDEYGLLPPCYPYDAEMINGHYTGQNLFALMGLRTCVRVAELLGKTKDVGAWTDLAARYEKNILKAIDASAKPDGYIPPGLYPYLTGSRAREGFEEYQTNCDWENMILAFPTEVLAPNDPRVTGTLSQVRKEYAEGVMTYRHGMHLHQYITSNMVEQYLAAGNQYTALKDFYHQLLHSGPTLECFENLVTPWTDRMVDPECPTPHAWGSAKQALMVRNFLLMEYGGKCGMEPSQRELWLFNCLSPDWVRPGKSVSIGNAPTEFGKIDASMTFRESGADIVLKNQFHTSPRYYRIRIPYFKRLVSFTTDASIKKTEDSCILLSPDATHVKIEWRDKAGTQTGITNDILSDYRSANRFAGVKDGDAVVEPGKPFLLEEEKKNSHKTETLSFELVRKAFQHEYNRLAKEFVEKGGKLTEISLPSITADSLSASPRAQGYLSTGDAVQAYAATLKQRAFIAFPETREHPIQWLDSVKADWLNNNYAAKPFVLHAQPGEYFVFQAGIWAIHDGLKNVQVKFSDFKNGEGKIIASNRSTCFNLGGTDYQGMPLKKVLDITGRQIQALWMGINLPVTAKGIYSGTVTIYAKGISQKIKIELNISGPAVADQGLDEGRRLSRLSWLNSTVGIDERITKGYIPVSRNGRTIKILGRSMVIGDNGLPADITTYFTSSNQSVSKQGSRIINQPFHFIIETKDGSIIHLSPGSLQFTRQTPSLISWKVINTSPECDLVCSAKIGFDGVADYHLSVNAKKKIDIKDIRLEISMNKDKATYMMGLNKEGGLRPETWKWKWDSARNQDALWLGAVNGGLRIKWKSDNYVLPLVNVYYSFGKLHLPSSWANAGEGGVNVSENQNAVIVNGYSGSRTMTKGEQQQYDFELLITPFKTINKAVQYGDRYYQSVENQVSDGIQKADSLGANIITIHHGNDLYPFINYPYSDVNVGSLKDFISTAHKDNKRVKIYNTTRELTINLPELWPFLSLNGEIIYPGPGASTKTVTNPGGPDAWLKENLRARRYIPAWVVHFNKGKFAGMQDMSVITTPDSRLNNFYAAGLDWMTKHLSIDGIYIDDCSLDRTTISRARKILDDNRPAVSVNIDMHSWNHFTESAGFASCLNLYMDLLPYIDQVWIGEDRNYDTPPDYWLVEISGIPFGLPGQMLQDGGNPWRGMIYGITNRAGWTGTPPDHIWQFWDQYGIKNKTMIGYWDPAVPVKADNDAVKVTVYKDASGTILAVGNFTGEDQACSLLIDYKKLGYDQSKCSVSIPAIEHFQAGQSSSGLLDHLQIPAKKGLLIIIKAQ